MKPLLTDFNNFEFVSVEMEGLNNLLVEIQVAQGNFLQVLENDSDIASANSWYEALMEMRLSLRSLSVNICLR